MNVLDIVSTETETMEMKTITTPTTTKMKTITISTTTKIKTTAKIPSGV